MRNSPTGGRCVILAGPMEAESAVDRQRELARAMDGLGVLLKKTSGPGESEHWLRTALELRRRLAASGERSCRPPG